MGIYLSGVFLGLIINLVRLFATLLGSFSTKTKNFKRVNLHYNITTGSYSKKKPGRWAKLFYAVDMLLISPLLSWLYIGWILIAYVRRYIDKVPVPEKIKEVNFKLSSGLLPPDKVKECLGEIAAFYGLPDALFRTFSDDDDDDSNLFVFHPRKDNNDWHYEIELNPSLKQYTLRGYPPDPQVFMTVCEYRIDNTEIFSKVIEEKEQRGADIYYEIKDNVVLESDVRERMSKSLFLSSQERIDEKIIQLRKEVEWQKTPSRFKYFIMFRHGDIFKDEDIRKYFRAELQRIKSGYTVREQEVIRLGGVIEQNEYSGINWDDKLSHEKVDLLCSIRDNPDKFNLSGYEIQNFTEITEELTLYLNRIS